MTPLLTIRSTAARVGGWAWMAFAALNLLDIAVRGRDWTALVMAALLLLGCGIAYVLGLRPAVVADEDGLTVRNPLRGLRVPWRAVRKIEAGTSIGIGYLGPDGDERAVKAWAVQTSPRAQAKAERRMRRDAAALPGKLTAEQLKGRTATKHGAQELNELKARFASKKKAPKGETVKGAALEWSWPAVASLTVPGVLVVVTFAAALLT